MCVDVGLGRGAGQGHVSRAQSWHRELLQGSLSVPSPRVPAATCQTRLRVHFSLGVSSSVSSDSIALLCLGHGDPVLSSRAWKGPGHGP